MMSLLSSVGIICLVKNLVQAFLHFHEEPMFLREKYQKEVREAVIYVLAEFVR